MNVDGRCDGDEDECQGLERGNKPLRLGVTLELSTSPLSNTSEFSLRRLESVANDSGLSAERDIAWSSRVSVGSFQRSLRETSDTSEATLRSVRVGWVGWNIFRVPQRNL